MKKLLLLVSVLTITLVLSACGSKEKLYVLNWGEYMDPEIIEMFEDEYNVVVVYDEVEKFRSYNNPQFSYPYQKRKNLNSLSQMMVLALN